ncbi:MAG: thymidine phosphorylase, partial [Acidobacteria bacterium]
QGGDPRIVEDYSRLPGAHHVDSVVAFAEGYVAGLEAEAMGRASMVLGAGRERVDSVIDPAVGLVFEKKVGDPVEAGERICAVYSNDRARLARALEMIRGAIAISPEPVARPPLILGEAL